LNSVDCIIFCIAIFQPTFDLGRALLFAWRSAVWTYATVELEKVAGGLRSVPVLEDFIEEIDTECPFAWP
jgi:hypothetical protein